MPLDKAAARQRIQQFDFAGLFTQELGWDWHRPTQPVTVAGRSFTLQAVAEKRGFVAWHCPTPAGEKLPDSALRRRIEREVTKAAHEHLVIFTDAAQTMQVWQWVRRESGKPLRVRETLWSKGQSGELLLQKLAPLFVSLDDEEKINLPIIAGRAAANVDERVTKRFYEEFRKQHAGFLKFITGIPNQGDHEWYASVMLNRLMFLYFVQRKGFLDGDPDYLRNRLQKLKAEHGKDKFYNFYRYFLLKLFHGGLNARLQDRQPEMEKLLGRVPYLNGGIFDVHTLERTYGDAIQIPDTAFEAIFRYFDEWQWHLDERPLREDKEINPDVLGYIFEKYINQKQMGAYYTKEDITEYIGKNTILPFLFDRSAAILAAAKNAAGREALDRVWQMLRDDPDRYLYPAVRHGLSWDYQPGHPELGEALAKERPLPADIAAGLEGSAGVPPASSTNEGQDARAPIAPFLNPFEEIEKHRHNLPHWQQGEAWQFVTWRLADSMPKSKLDEWAAEKAAWLKHHARPWDEATEREYHDTFSQRMDEWLDAGHGSCLLREPACAHIVAAALRHFDGQRYQLGPFVVMPNHVHALFQPLTGHALEDILHSWKSFTSKEINKHTGRSGTLWQEDYWDRMIRHEAHWHACRRYILANPAKHPQGTFVLHEGSAGTLPANGDNAGGTPALLLRRKPWNKPAPATHGLPTEIWRETVARRQRCAEVRQKLAAGEVRDIADFITLNLDLRRFAQDVIARCDSAELLAAFWHALAGRPARNSREKPQPALTVLDPTCGSGAFLFAALNILEPLYEACLDRMEGLLADHRSAGVPPAKLHPDSHLAEFEHILQQVARHPNERYFIFKTIILHNLYGVDLMEEAVEICKLRLFLKLAAQVEPDAGDANLGIEPLPDIDFNIRAGNTLVGYATRAELEAVAERDLLLKQEVKEVIEAAEDAAAAYEVFVRSQLDGENPAEFKRRLHEKFGHAREQCDRFLALSYGIEKERGRPARNVEQSGRDARTPFAEWKRSHQPFHWFVEFFGILSKGGFDVIIGNPPYVSTAKARKSYTVKNLVTADCSDIYAWVLERSENLLREHGRSGMIVPLSLGFSSDFDPCRRLLLRAYGDNWFSSFGRIPAALFAADVRVRNTIHIGYKSKRPGKSYTTRLHRWFEAGRGVLFQALEYAAFQPVLWKHRIPKLNTARLAQAFERAHAASSHTLDTSTSSRATRHVLHFKKSAYNWLNFCRSMPPCYEGQRRVEHTKFGEIYFGDAATSHLALLLANGKLMMIFWFAIGDDFDVTRWNFADFPADLSKLPAKQRDALLAIAPKLEKAMEDAVQFKLNAGRRVGNYNLAKCRDVTDESDRILAEALGLQDAWEDIELYYAQTMKTDFSDDDEE